MHMLMDRDILTLHSWFQPFPFPSCPALHHAACPLPCFSFYVTRIKLSLFFEQGVFWCVLSKAFLHRQFQLLVDHIGSSTSLVCSLPKTWPRVSRLHRLEAYLAVEETTLVSRLGLRPLTNKMIPSCRNATANSGRDATSSSQTCRRQMRILCSRYLPGARAQFGVGSLLEDVNGDLKHGCRCMLAFSTTTHRSQSFASVLSHPHVRMPLLSSSHRYRYRYRYLGYLGY